MSTPRLRNAMTVDVEDWFQVQAFAGVIDRDAWPALAPRVAASTDAILRSFEAAHIRATFFVLGWVAERNPALIQRIVAAGHELASHGYGHERVDVIGEAAFRADIRRAKHVLEDISGMAIAGYRAPTFSISRARTPWAHNVLAEEAYGYSSSTFPIRHDLYGDTRAPRRPHFPCPDGVVELPMTTLSLFGQNLPCAGGGWFRLLPYRLFRAGLRSVNAHEGHAGIFYFHPWEVDPGQPRQADAPLKARIRHYTGIPGMQRRIERLLQDFEWDRLDSVYASEIGASAPVLA